MVDRYRKKDAAGIESCSGCGMILAGPRVYHPHVACVLFRASRNSSEVDANLRAVVEYGMRAQAAGVPLGTAMCDFPVELDAPQPTGEVGDGEQRASA